MELAEAIRRRRMTRRFADTPVAPEVLGALLDGALRAPSAGHAQGLDLVVLETAPARDAFWRATTDAGFLESSPQAAALRAAPLVVVPVVDPGAYLRRYAEPDKAGSGLAGLAPERWPVPYWLVDASFATMLLLLGAVDAGLGALFFRLHCDEQVLLAHLGAPPDRRVIGAVALGHRLEEVETRPARARRAPGEAIHRDRW